MKIDGENDIYGLLQSSAIFALIYFAETKIFSLKAKVHILPIISFIESSNRENASVFFSRLAGQIAGAVLAFLIIWLTHDKENITFLTFQFIYIALV
ncbi:MAG: hypothetical protein WD577_02390 [Bacteroidales bacterium]